jgi:HD-GYP domain-containing protein (c-di-GMP phosphodiesterase class II)
MVDTNFPATEVEFQEFMLQVVRTLLAVLEEKDLNLKKHSERIANNCASFCEKYKLIDEKQIESFYFAGLIHDIGLVALPLNVIQNPDSLDDDEQVSYKKHTIVGEKIIANLGYLQHILPIIRHHHEFMDGSGYPDGIKGEEIPLEARIICLFNVYDNLTKPHSQKNALEMEEALKRIKNDAGTRFDEGLMEKFSEFIEATSGVGENFLEKKENAAIKQVFTKILDNFKAGKINPPVMPQVVRQVQNVIKKPTSTAEELSAEIEKDPVISLRLISVGNSPIYRGIQEIRTVKDSIPRLGLKETLNIVMAIANKSLYETDNAQFRILMDKLWVHSLASAYGSRLIAQHLRLPDTDRFFLMGLTHDIGKILLLKAFTDVSKNKGMNIDAVQASIQEAHLALGGMLLKRWGFGEDFIKVVAMHEGGNFTDQTEKEILVIHLANRLTRKIGFSLFDGEFEIEEVDSAVILKLDAETLDGIGEEVKNVVSDVAHLF